MGAQEASKEYLKIIAQKDSIIEDLNIKMSYMSAEFESMLNVSRNNFSIL